MTEKWLLVLLIVGSTSLVFLICFPIDFYLYRRRKRLARERKNITLPWYRPQTPTRAAQVHATVTVTSVAAEIDFDEMNDKDRKAYRAQRGIIRFLSKIRRKRNRRNQEESFVETKSENGSDCRILPSPETSHTIEDAEHKSRNIFGNANDNISDTRYPDFNEMVTEGKYRKRMYDGMGDYDSSEETFTRLSARKYSSVAHTWGENDELVGREIKQLNYGAFEPLENLTSFTNEINDSNCFTIPVRGRCLVLVKPAIGEGYTDYNPSNGDIHQDLVVESKLDRSKSATTEGGLEMPLNLTSEKFDRTKTGSDVKPEPKEQNVFPPSEEFSKVDIELELKQYRCLLRAQSDQNLSSNTKLVNNQFKTKKKVNIISPKGKKPSNVGDQFFTEGNDKRLPSNRKSFSFQESLFISDVKENIKNSTCLKKPFESMPELKFYQKKEF